MIHINITHSITIYTMICHVVTTISILLPRTWTISHFPENLKVLCLAPDHQRRVEMYFTYRIYFISHGTSDPFNAVKALIILLFWSEFLVDRTNELFVWCEPSRPEQLFWSDVLLRGNVSRSRMTSLLSAWGRSSGAKGDVAPSFLLILVWSKTYRASQKSCYDNVAGDTVYPLNYQ